MLMSVCGGKWATKGVRKNNEGMFEQFYMRTKVEELVDETYSNGLERGYIVEYEGKVYRVGEEATKMDYDVSKTKFAHKLMIYVAIADMLENYEKVDLMVGCPLSTFVNKEKKDFFKEFLLGGQERNIELTLNGKYKRFLLNSVNPLPESLGYVYQEPNYNMGRLFGVIDIGGLNVNGAVYEKLKPIKDTAFTINEGSIILFNKIKKALNTQYETNFQDYEIPYLLKNGVFIEGERVEEADDLIQGIFRKHIDTIIEECKKHNWNTKAIDMAFSGGGALDIKECISNYMPHVSVSEKAIWDNPYAYYRVGELLGIGKGEE